MAATVKTKKKSAPKPKAKPKASPKSKPVPKPAGKKTPVKPRAKPKSKDESLKLPDNVCIDPSTYDWGNEKLTDNQKLFIIWFATPGQECYRKGMKAARKAGYTAKTAHAVAYKLRKELDRHIQLFEESVGKVNIIDTAQRWLHEKVIRGDYKTLDFYKTVEYEDKLGQPQQKMILKSAEELTPEQHLCIDGIDVKGQQGTPIFNLPDREKVRDSLINFVQKSQGGGDDEYNFETVAEIIKVNIRVKSKVINKNIEIMKRAEGFVDAPRKTIEEE